MAERFTTKRKFSGYYEVTDGENTVIVETWESPDTKERGWIAAAQWDRLRYSDVLGTKRHAVEVARHMLETANDF